MSDPKQSANAGLEPLLLLSVEPIEVGNMKVRLRSLTLHDMFQIKRIFRESMLWGGYEMGQKLGTLLASLGNLGQSAGLLLTPLLGIPDVEGMLIAWLGDVFYVVEVNGIPENKPYLPLGPEGISNVPLPSIYSLLSAVVRHPDFESFFGQLRTQNLELINQIQTILKSFLPPSNAPGNEESTSSSTDTQETPTT